MLGEDLKIDAVQEASSLIAVYLYKDGVLEKISNPNVLKYLRKLSGKPDESNLSALQLSQKQSYNQESHNLMKNDLSINATPNMDEKTPNQQRSKIRKMSSKREGSHILIPGMNAEGKNATTERMNKIMADYLPIAYYIAWTLDHVDEKAAMTPILQKSKDMEKFDPEYMLKDRRYLNMLLKSILIYEEAKIYDDLLERIESLNTLLTDDTLSLFEAEFRFEYLSDFFERCNTRLSKRNSVISRAGTLVLNVDDINSPKGSPNTLKNSDEITDGQIKLMIQKYTLCNPKNNTIMSILERINLGPQEIVGFYLDSGESDRLISIALERDQILSQIKDDDLIKKRAFKVLIVYDRGELIKIFNKTLDGGSKTVYDEICKLIGEGTDVEDLCNVVIHVHNTFWDMEKLPKFYKALEAVLSENEYHEAINGRDIEEKQDEPEQRDSWLLHIQNPLLFCIKLVYFFQKMKKQLDFKNKEMNDLKKALLAFCISFCQNADEDVLMINLFDKDTKDRGFLEYAFMIQEMSILDIEFIEGLIYKMWDLGRHTMQSITQFMRINFMKDEIKKFSMNVFVRKYEMPIEPDDVFQMEFRFTSNSVFLRVVSDIFWPITLIIIEFIFSMRIIALYKEFNFDSNWMSEYFYSNPFFSVLHMYMRGSFIVSNILKTMLMKIFKGEGFFHQYFYNLLNVLYILQMVVYPIFFWYEFWLISNLQMLIVLTMVGYVFYNSLALNDIGVILRIFARMVYVVLIFGIVSCFIMIMIAYPLHTIYIDFTQKVAGETFPEQNMFRSLYNGVLTLFEFVFGAVVFVRPYIEENLYTYSMSFIMVIFSFFGNIMMANMLVAFLSRQFEDITRKAKYYTQRMQFGLVKIFNMQDLDAIFTMPYPLTALFLPVYFGMIKGGATRKKLNLFLRKAIHIVNIFIPTFIIMNIFLLVLLVIRYIEILLFVLIRAPVKPMYILYFFCWIVGGPVLLLKLYVLDVATMIKIMLNFGSEGDDLLSTSLDEESLKNVINLFKKISREAIKFMPRKGSKKGVQKISIQKILEYMGLSKASKKIIKRRESIAQSMEQRGNEDEDDVEEDDEENAQSFKAKYSAFYSQSANKLIPILLKKFAIQEGKSESTDKQIVDLEFMVKKLKNNVNLENVHKLIGFDKTSLDRANRFISDSSKQNDVMTELVNVKEKMQDMDKQIDEIMHIIKELKDK